MEKRKSKRYYEFISTEEFHDKCAEDITYKAVWQGFQSQTTAHGIPHVKNARGPIKTTFWLISSLVCCGLLIYYAYFLFDKYLSYPVNVTVNIKSKHELDFPAITVCNHNMVKKSSVADSRHPELRALFGLPPLSSGGSDGVTTETTTEALDAVALQTGGTLSHGGRAVRQNFEYMLALQEILANMTHDERSSMGYDDGEFIIDCEYAGGVCSSDDFVDVIKSSVFGNCYTFNFKNTSNIEKSFRPGPQYGLHIILNINQDEYHGKLAQTAGARIVVHDRSRMPFPEDEGISVAPGLITYVGMKLLSVNRLGDPYGKCKDKNGNDFHNNVYAEVFGVGYSSSACTKTCLQYHIMKRCECSASIIPSRGRAFQNLHAHRICRYGNEEDRSCSYSVEEEYKSNKLNCDCPQACTDSTYTLTTSHSLWPSDEFEDSLLQALALQNPLLREMRSAPGDPDKFKRNLIKVVLYFEEFNYEKITEVALYESFAFVSDIGGILGLFIGFSVMTIGEFLELGLDLVVLSVIKKCRWCQGNKTSNIDTTTRVNSVSTLQDDEIMKKLERKQLETKSGWS